MYRGIVMLEHCKLYCCSVQRHSVQSHASNYVVTVWGRTTYGCRGQTSTYFWPHSGHRIRGITALRAALFDLFAMFVWFYCDENVFTCKPVWNVLSQWLRLGKVAWLCFDCSPRKTGGSGCRPTPDSSIKMANPITSLPLRGPSGEFWWKYRSRYFSRNFGSHVYNLC